MTSRNLVGWGAIPNAITLARLFAAPVTIWLVVVDEYVLAFWLFVAAGLSDAVDGILARVLNARSMLGAYLDPIADKTLIMGIFFALGYNGDLPDWIVMLVVSRDVFILGGAVLVHTLKPGNAAIRPSPISKLNTVLQIVLAGIALGFSAFAIGAGWVVGAVTLAVAVTTVLSGLGYLMEAGRRLGTEPQP